MTREEKLAQKLLTRHSLTPPYDLMDLVNKYAEVEFDSFPFDADGLTVGIKSENPKIYINSSLPPTRAAFTLAHELGHVSLPWHIGTIVSDNYNGNDHSNYRTMEAEANRFAAELLMPTYWIKNQLQGNIPFFDKIRKVIVDAKVSPEAAFIKIMNNCEEPRYLLIMESDGSTCNKEFTTEYSKQMGFSGKFFKIDDVYSAYDYEEINLVGIKTITFLIGNMDDNIFNNNDSRSWREILQFILTEVDVQDHTTIQSANATLPASFQRHKEKEVLAICKQVRLDYEGRTHLVDIVNHELFPIYIRKRVDELKAKNLLKVKI